MNAPNVNQVKHEMKERYKVFCLEIVTITLTLLPKNET
jgi:hypothetical protein